MARVTGKGLSTKENRYSSHTSAREPLYTWFARHPGVKRALAGAGAGAVALLAAHALRKEDGGAPR
jgi:hypothetical protein